MQKAESGNLAKLVAFFLIATVLIIAISISVSGWQENPDTEPDSGNVDDNTNDNADENIDGSGDNDVPTVAPAPSYTHYLTGLEISEEESLVKPFALVLDTTSPLYAISGAKLLVEIPTEHGNTRYLAFTDDATTAGKLGSIASTRDYISNIAEFFGGILVSFGNDDKFDYDALTNTEGHIDFSLIGGYHYKEFDEYCYTNADLVKAYIRNNNISTLISGTNNLPYIFNTSETSHVGDVAGTIVISHSDEHSTEFTYDSECGIYHMTKNNTPVTDMLYDKTVGFNNVIVLYADATTYETKDATETIFNTKGSGEGFYAAEGKVEKISWNTTDDGELVFLNNNGERLAVNPGTSYIGYVKSSDENSVKFG